MHKRRDFNDDLNLLYALKDWSLILVILYITDFFFKTKHTKHLSVSKNKRPFIIWIIRPLFNLEYRKNLQNVFFFT